MTDFHTYGDDLLSKVDVVAILKKCDLPQENIDILILRYSYEWHHDDIAHYIGMKYKGRPYSEGTVRYRIRKSLETITEYLKSIDQI